MRSVSTMELDKLTDLHFSAHLVDRMLEYRAIGTRYISLQQSCSRGNSLRQIHQSDRPGYPFLCQNPALLK